jgi:uncharacterized protein (TIGR00255 family)
MAIQSMTGYGRAERHETDYTVSIELKSVNNRFLEFQCRNSKELLHLEPALKTELSKHVQRGSVTCHLHYESQSPDAGGVSLNQPLFRSYLHVIESMRQILGPSTQVNPGEMLGSLLRIPDLVTPAFSHESPETVTARILPVFTEACLDLAQSRGREGEALATDLRNRIVAFKPALERVRGLIPERQNEYVAKMRLRVQDILGDRNLAEDRLLTEISLMAERLDVTEEIVRLATHLDHFLETLETQKAPGKRLGFLLQEMLREVNTLGTKSQYADIQHTCVAWKEDLEILREQIQNLE